MNFNSDINLQDILTTPISAEQKAAILKEMLVFVNERSEQYYFIKNLQESFYRIGVWEVTRTKEAKR